MNVTTFLEHYKIKENPFTAEEAREDIVFERIEGACHHPDFEKIRGDFHRPATSIVFGERGSGKTALRMQIRHDLEHFNREKEGERCFLIEYDEFNPILDRFANHQHKAANADALKKMKLIDHLDGILNCAVAPIVDQALEVARDEEHPPLVFEGPTKKRFRKLSRQGKHDLLMLQVCYDRPQLAHSRTARLRRTLRYGPRGNLTSLKFWSIFFLALTALLTVAMLIKSPEQYQWVWITGIVLLLIAGCAFGGRFLWQWFRTQHLAGELSKHLRIINRPTSSFRQSLSCLNPTEVFAANLPSSASDDARYHMFRRLRNLLHEFGYNSLLILVDRVDEPTLVNGDANLMRHIIWPMLNNKFLQQDRIGIKMLLPIELRHVLQRESPEFYREARLDKQNLIERLRWSGATLFDLCSARLNACRPFELSPMSLTEMFDDSVTQQDIIDALDQMQQPRDAFKFMYALLQEHCSRTTDESPDYTISKSVLETVRRQQAERVMGMLQGVRPA